MFAAHQAVEYGRKMIPHLFCAPEKRILVCVVLSGRAGGEPIKFFPNHDCSLLRVGKLCRQFGGKRRRGSEKLPLIRLGDVVKIPATNQGIMALLFCKNRDPATLGKRSSLKPQTKPPEVTRVAGFPWIAAAKPHRVNERWFVHSVAVVGQGDGGILPGPVKVNGQMPRMMK